MDGKRGGGGRSSDPYNEHIEVKGIASIHIYKNSRNLASTTRTMR